jgi:hypothetical protein
MKSRLIQFCCIPLLLSLAPIADAGEPPEERVILVGQGRITEMPYAKGLTASKVIIAGGGMADFSGTRIFLVRCGHATPIDIEAALLRGQLDQDPELQPWDIITIGTAITRPK